MTGHRLPLTPEAARLLTLNTEPWLSCDDCFALVDEYVEQVAHRDTTRMLPMQAHLLGCSACFEEARSLLLLVAPDLARDPAQADRLLLSG